MDHPDSALPDLRPKGKLPDHETFDLLVRHGTFSADLAAVNSRACGGTMAAMTRAGVRAALVTLFKNGLITVVNRESWPEYIIG